MYHNKSFYYSRAHDAWLSVIAIKTGKQHQISLELEKQDFWQVPAAAATAAASATSAARLRLVLTSCRQGRLTGLGLLTLQKRWSTKLQSHLKNSNNVKTASQKYYCVPNICTGTIICTVRISGGSYCSFSLLHYSSYYTYCSKKCGSYCYFILQ